ncbi:M15 family metallopeptidase [Mumia sp. zg.B53]|uniref:M15 family metallopeptidase n=1 Tax=Mumia sp. zg.B53 TaxID=2855449 RepID=UPI001C6E9DE4|nr:M15 family metallopeptidase [Mumia sp. zg.B53]MBW9213277.1 M15 family metallopeptidase [Mumia sp. zg.B53]
MFGAVVPRSDHRHGNVAAMASLILMGDPRVAEVPAEDCGEKLVDSRELSLATDPDENPQNPLYFLLRASVAERLLKAEEQLPTGIRLLLVEGYRPYEQQAFYFNRRKQRLMDAEPELSESGAHMAASEFVSPPDIAPHVSGAAVDLTLIDAQRMRLDMGTAIDARPEDCDQACYFAAKNISQEARQNRHVLASAMHAAGFVNYPTEWWHWSYGDRYWALLTGRSQAIYGAARVS